MPFSSKAYWSERYSAGRRSGGGSYGKLAAFKAEVLNAFLRENAIGSVIEFGCGDGNQLGLSDYPAGLCQTNLNRHAKGAGLRHSGR